jgi:hypothetical protein
MADTRKKMRRPVAVADLLSSAFHGKPAGKRLEEGKIWLVWDAAVGKQIAGKARPVSFREGILTVAVVSAPWMQQLTFLKQGMIEKLNERLGTDLVHDIFLKAGLQEAKTSAPKPGGREARRLTSEEVERVATQTETIRDDELRAQFARLMSRYIADH